MNKHLIKKLMWLSLFFSTGLLAEVSPQLIAYNCFSCHGDKLVKNELSLPYSKNKLLRILLSFKYDKKAESVMNRIAKGYTDAQLKAVASHLIGKD